MNLAAKPPNKERIGLFINFLIKQIQKTNINIKLNEELTIEKVKALAPDLLVVATGALTTYPCIPGIERDIVIDGLDILAGKVLVEGLEVIVIGGGITGCEIAAYMLRNGNKVTIIEKNSYLAMDMEKKNRRDLLNYLDKGLVKKKTSTQSLGITEGGLWIQSLAGEKEFLKANKIVLATGVKSQQDLYMNCQGIVSNMVIIGDANHPRDFRQALQEADILGKAWRRS